MQEHSTPSPEVVRRFWRKVNKSEGCWIWTGAISGCGYGHVWDGKQVSRAHRVSYILAFGSIPGGLDVLHRCDVPTCVRPDHLFLGTHADNMRDKSMKGRNGRPNALPDSLVLAVRKAQAESPMSQTALAAKFGISQGAVSRLLRGATYTRLEEAA